MKNKLKFGIFKRQGINNKGRITIYNRGGGEKYRLYLIDYKRDMVGIPAKIIKILPGYVNKCMIGLIYYTCGIFSYVLMTNGLVVGDYIITYDGYNYLNLMNKKGMVLSLKHCKVGDYVHSVELYPGKGAIIGRSMNTGVKIVKVLKEQRLVLLKLSSGIYRYINEDCKVVIGALLIDMNKLQNIGKAGIKRILGYRPKVRGVAMNPIDHPHGGGQGKTKGGRCSVTPWGRLTRGKKTCKEKRKNKKVIKKL